MRAVCFAVPNNLSTTNDEFPYAVLLISEKCDLGEQFLQFLVWHSSFLSNFHSTVLLAIDELKVSTSIVRLAYCSAADLYSQFPLLVLGQR